MKKRLLVSLVAALALGVVVSPALAQAKAASPKSATKAQASLVRALNAKALTSARPAASPSANWTIGGTMVKATSEHGGGAAAGPRLYVPGGFDSTGAVFGQMQIYSIASNTWTLNADLLSALTGLPGVADAAICADSTGNIHVINGTLDGLSIYASHLLYTPTAPAGMKWSALAIPNTVADGNYYSQDSGCSSLGGKIYLYGGYGLTDMGIHATADVQKLTWAFDPVAGTWADTGRNMITGRIWQGYTANAARAFVCGGGTDVITFPPTNKCETFTVATGWKTMATLPAARIAPGMGFIGSTLTVSGGGDASFVAQKNTYGCVGSACGPGPWADLAKNLNTARWFQGFGFGGGKIFAAGGLDATNTTIGSTEFTT